MSDIIVLSDNSSGLTEAGSDHFSEEVNECQTTVIKVDNEDQREEVSLSQRSVTEEIDSDELNQNLTEKRSHSR